LRINVHDRELLEYIRKVYGLSQRMGIPSIEEEDGVAIASAAFAYASSGRRLEIVAVDAGAGIGYSTLWLILGLKPFCSEASCKVIAVELNRTYASIAEDVLAKAPRGGVEIEVVRGDAVKYVSELPGEYVDIIFVDIYKDQYVDIIDVLSTKLKKGGIAMFHNAYIPRPPTAFFERASSEPWVSTIVPTSLGILIASRKG
jgi:predicted O-methyltransferase YrrM